MATQVDRITLLKSEIAEIKKQRKQEKVAEKKSHQWISVNKSLPSDHARAIVWSDEKLKLGWFSGGSWYEYDGTWFLKDKDILNDVTHWMNVDWMSSNYWPVYGPGLINKVRYVWLRITQRASNMAYDLRPRGWGSKAQLSNKVTFLRDSSGRLMTGLPEFMPAPRGFEKIVCNNVQEAERYSEIQRRQERSEHSKQMEERGRIEGEFQAAIRSEMTTKMLNARNNTNREFMRRALERNANKFDPTRYERESYLHSEAFEERR